MPDSLTSPYSVPLVGATAWGGACLVLLFAGLWGWCLLVNLPTFKRGERVQLWLVFGLGVFAVAGLACGQLPGGFGFRTHIFALAITSIARILHNFFRPAAKFTTDGAPDQHKIQNTRDPLQISGFVALALYFLLLLAPAFCPPINYDVLEYHLGVIPHWFARGRIEPLPHVFYSAQPCATEIWYGLASRAEGTPWGHAPGALQWCVALVGAGCMLSALKAWKIPEPWRPWCVLLVLTHPLMVRILFDRLTDFTGVIYLACGLWLAAPGENKTEKLKIQWMLGALAGFAVGGKWTHAGTVAVPLLLLAGWTGARAASNKNEAIAFSFSGASRAAFICFVVWIPWGVWLWHVRGNPFAPFMAHYFPTPQWNGARLDFLLQTHGHVGPLAWSYWQNLFQRLVAGLPGLPLIALAFAGVLIFLLLNFKSKSKKEIPGLIPLLAGLLTGVLLWGQLIHAAERFMAVPLFTGCLILALLLVKIAPRQNVFQKSITAFWIIPALFSFWQFSSLIRDSGCWAYALGRESRAAYLHSFLGLTAEMFAGGNRLPPESRVLTINEARRYYFARDVDVVSVFDENPLRQGLSKAGNVEGLRQRLRDMGYTHVLVNEYELHRILHTHTPPELLENQELRELLRQTGPLPNGAPLNTELVTRFYGYTEFATAPLTSAEREIYANFYQQSFEQAIWRTGTGHPAMWIAPL